MRPIAADLWETSADAPLPGLTTHAYLWTPSNGENVLFYSVATDRDLDEIERLGGVAHQYLSHRDEASPMLDEIARRFGARLHASAAEEADIARHRRPDILFAQRTRDRNGIEILPTPGHSPGSTCFIVDGNGGRCLFTGDTLYRAADGRWAAGYLAGISDLGRLPASLDLIADLEPDLVISSAFAGTSGAHAVDPATWADTVGDVLRDLAALQSE
jgi:hydroxyacylglutathione hydrolase